jgi:hypothetical protein
MNDVPQETGLYFAMSTRKQHWYDLIVDIRGEAPMLYIACVFDRGLNGPRVYAAKPFEIAVWGPKIIEPKTKGE